MGGKGSGNWYRWCKKTTIDEVKRVDIRYMHRKGLLKPGSAGTLQWTRGGKPNGLIQYQCHDSHLQLSYRYRVHGGDWQPIEQSINIDRTACHFGGERPWFLCPNCCRRVAMLCCNGPLFLCRHCYRLPYESQQQSRMDRIISQKHKLGERIFEHYEYGEGWGKKKGMHWSTFHRLHKRYQSLEQQQSKYLGQYLDRF